MVNNEGLGAVVVVDLKHDWSWTVWCWELELSLLLRCALGLPNSTPPAHWLDGFWEFPV